MTNSYVTEKTDAEIAATKRKAEQDRFIGTHHHLINPRMYTTQQIQWRDTQMLVARWDAYTVKANTVKMTVTETGDRVPA